MLKKNVSTPSYRLITLEGKLSVVAKHSSTKPLSIDFDSAHLNYRRLKGGGYKQPVAKAVGVNNTSQPTVLDATAGFAEDAFILASLGCRVIMIERNPIMLALLTDGLKRAESMNEIMAITTRMQLIAANAIEFMQQLPATLPLEVIYLDPMFIHNKVHALPKKEMQFLHHITGGDIDADQLLLAAKSKAKKVVVKRPRISIPLAKIKPSYQLMGKRNRYDVYLS